MHDIDLDELAKVYLEACEAGQWPTKAVTEHFGYSRSTLNKYVIKARQAGLIPPTTTGKAPMAYRRCPTCGAPPCRWAHGR